MLTSVIGGLGSVPRQSVGDLLLIKWQIFLQVLWFFPVVIPLCHGTDQLAYRYKLDL